MGGRKVEKSVTRIYFNRYALRHGHT